MVKQSLFSCLKYIIFFFSICTLLLVAYTAHVNRLMLQRRDAPKKSENRSLQTQEGLHQYQKSLEKELMNLLLHPSERGPFKPLAELLAYKLRLDDHKNEPAHVPKPSKKSKPPKPKVITENLQESVQKADSNKSDEYHLHSGEKMEQTKSEKESNRDKVSYTDKEDENKSDIIGTKKPDSVENPTSEPDTKFNGDRPSFDIPKENDEMNKQSGLSKNAEMEQIGGQQSKVTVSGNVWDTKLIKSNSTDDGFEADNTRRIKQVQDICKTIYYKVEGSKPRAEFYYSFQKQLLYCKVAKGGCTFWEGFFSFISRPDSMAQSGYKSMYEIPRWRIHFDQNVTPPAVGWNTAKSISDTAATRFMFTRDPFSRVWSAFVDKIWLPDFWFWMKIGRHTSFVLTDRCMTDVTFSDFIEYASDVNKSNKHWAPVHESCNPCQFQPHILGNLSTFARDARHVLQKASLEHFLDSYNHHDHVLNELTMLVEYNYKRLAYNWRLFKACQFKERDMAYRLWKTFQINGYIHRHSAFPSNLSSYDKTTVLKKIIKTVDEKPLSSEEGKQQRQHYMTKAYRSVSPDILERMKKRYSVDFILFGFDKNPSFLPLKQEEVIPFKIE